MANAISIDYEGTLKKKGEPRINRVIRALPNHVLIVTKLRLLPLTSTLADASESNQAQT